MTFQKIADAVGVSYNTAWRAAQDVELIENDKLPGTDGTPRPARRSHYQF